MKRTPSSGMGSTMKESAFQTEPRVSESLVRHTSTSPADKAKVTISDGKVADEEKPKKSSLCRTVEGCREELQNQVGPGGGAAEPGGPWWRSRRAGWAPAAHSVGAERGAWRGALLPATPVVVLSSKVADVQHVNSRRVCGPPLLHRECVAEECLEGLCEGGF